MRKKVGFFIGLFARDDKYKITAEKCYKINVL